MKKILLITLALSLISFLAHSQDESEFESKFGVGISTSFNYMEVYYSDYPTGLNKVYLTINLSDDFRIEPAISGGITTDKDYYGYLGLGLFYKKLNEAQKFHALFGLRIGASYNDYEELGYHISPTVGGEYHLGKSFSLGGEIQVTTILIQDGSDSSELSIITSIVTPLVLRFYFK